MSVEGLLLFFGKENLYAVFLAFNQQVVHLLDALSYFAIAVGYGLFFFEGTFPTEFLLGHIEEVTRRGTVLVLLG